MCYNTESVLKVKLIAGNLGINFSLNDLQKDARVSLVETLEIYIHYNFAC